ncbi:hypothetical protein ACWDFL_16210 [Streptomyces bungoensis]
MIGGLPPLRNRHVAAVFILVMYSLLGALLAALIAAGLSRIDVRGSVAVVVGGALGAVFGVWRIRRTPKDERADESGAR